jgi:hypothetical protein
MYGLRELLDNIQKTANMKIIDDLKEKLVSFFIYYTRFETNVKEQYKNLYDNNVIARKIIDYSKYYIDYVYSGLISKKIEPLTTNWISSSILSKRDKNRYVGEEFTLLENYEFIKNHDAVIDGTTHMEASFNEICDIVDSIILNNPNYIEGLVKMKIGEKYIYRMFDHNNGLFKDFKLPLIKSEARFLNIEYTHPVMNKTIVIELDNNVYFTNNQILSPSFVKQYLEHQSEFYHFDMDYKLKIIDSDINSLELGFDQSVLLNENGYKLV